MKKIILLLTLVTTLLSARLEAQAVKLVGPGQDNINQWSDSVVRIFSQDGKGDGFETQPTDIIDFGTGFVINDAGYIVTNNHVASTDPDKSQSHSMCVVLETVTTPEGRKRYLHKATVVWFSPANDLAVLQCSNLHARPIPLDLTPPQDGDRVHCLGYPVISDLIAGGPPEFANFFVSLAHAVAPGWETQDVWDFTEIANQRTWSTYCKPTRTDGEIRDADLLEGPWGGGDGPIDIPVIQHSLDIMPGNSGGPLFSDHGGVIGVVGDGMRDTENGDEKVRTEYATTVAPLIQWLGSAAIPGVDDQHHYYQLGFSSATPVVVPQASLFFQTTLIVIILGLLLALGLEFVILRFTWEQVAQSRLADGVKTGTSHESTRPAHHFGENMGSLGREFLQWVPLHIPHPAPLVAYGKRHAGLVAAVILCALTLGWFLHPPSHPSMKNSRVVTLSTPAILALSPADLVSATDAPQVQPPGGFMTHFRPAFSTLGHVAMMGLFIMVAWRVVLAVVRFVKRPRHGAG